jgi:hypothetical protein
MKTYELFIEAISARRQEELRKKGKGDALDAKMKADGLESEKTKRSSAIVPTKGKMTQPKGQLAKTAGSAAAGIGSEIVKATASAISNRDKVKKAKVKVDPPYPQRPGTSRTYDDFKKDDDKKEKDKKKKKNKWGKRLTGALKRAQGPSVNPTVSSGTSGKADMMKHTGGAQHF